MKVTCNQCGQDFDDADCGMAFNMGFGPVYICLKCAPPATAEEIIASIKEIVDQPPGQ